MRKQDSKSREDYKRAYRLIRQKGTSGYIQFMYGEPNEIQDCALLSYDYHDSKFGGWIDRNRMHKWSEVFSDRYPDLYYQF